ncbi:E3 ubiquitin-protein ligase RNF167 [Hondaea fermentalgiana]|uniref:E3 ubiquitin-protein ligase RNF167 n=1 Tax=Hondaea fermentalgiana TaxID=2315210 RepID=A0A2R5GV86_9STRA|nr:E3 ubiquitin-protein ligase RNF167 [Hondaea fermentalgiana]|eukprot:GBG32311.1 E3 ubiquitin-protein ligase RNF167 [Hondaea fermentalgiana]
MASQRDQVSSSSSQSAQSVRRGVWAKLRNLARARKFDRLATQYWPQYGLVAVTPQVVMLHEKHAAHIYEAVRKEAETRATPSSTLVHRGTSVLRRAAAGLERSRRRFEVFSFGLTDTSCDVTSVFASGMVHVSSGDPARTGIVAPCSCIDDVRRILQWTRADGHRVAFVIAASEQHLQYLAITCVLLSAASQGRATDVAEAMTLFQHVRETGLSGLELSNGGSTISAQSTNVPPMPTSPRLRTFSASYKRTNLWSRVNGRALWGCRNSSSSSRRPTFGDPDGPDARACARRVVGALGYVRPALPAESEPMYWRRMVLRKVVLSHAPRISSEDRAAPQGCRPYVMVMNGDQTDFLHSTMVQGIREARYLPNTDVAFDINRRVERDVVLKVYHLEPGQPGRVIIQTHVNVAGAEPFEDASVAEEFPEGEQLVMVNIPKTSLDVQSLGNTLDADFQLTCVFGMMPDDRAMALQGPRTFSSEQGLTGYGHADDSATVASLDLSTPLPPLQFNADEETHIEGSTNAAGSADADDTRADATSAGATGAGAAGGAAAAAADPDEDDDGQTESGQASARATEVQRRTGAFDVEAAFEARRETVCEILGAVRPNERREIEQRLHFTLEFCHSESEAEAAVQNFVTQSLESPSNDSLWGRRSMRRSVRFNLGARDDDDDSQVRFNLPSGGGSLRGEDGSALARHALRNMYSDRGPQRSNAPRVVLLPDPWENGSSIWDHMLGSVISSRRRPDLVLAAHRRRGTGMSEHDILRLPEHEFTSSSFSGDQSNCLICLGDYSDGDRLRTLPCFQ